jgi:predicted DNA-binding transcriptional regulator AlpA
MTIKQKVRPRLRASADDEPRASTSLTPSNKRFVDKAEVCDRVGRSFVTLWTWMQQGKFPRARDLHGRPVWIEAEIDAWMQALPVRRLKGDSDAR